MALHVFYRDAAGQLSSDGSKRKPDIHMIMPNLFRVLFHRHGAKHYADDCNRFFVQCSQREGRNFYMKQRRNLLNAVGKQGII